jgi:hypothetical protein
MHFVAKTRDALLFEFVIAIELILFKMRFFSLLKTFL